MSHGSDSYIDSLPADRREPFARLLQTIRDNLPAGFQEAGVGNPAWIVPLSAYPAGYHVKPGTPLPFMSLVCGKQAITLHHFGLNMNPKLSDWFKAEFLFLVRKEPDMGKSCVRFRKMDLIPYELIGELVRRVSMSDFIRGYERALGRKTG